MGYCPTPTLHLNLALTGDFVHFFILKKTPFSMIFKPDIYIYIYIYQYSY